MADYYGIGKQPVFEGLSTYRSPLVFELSGRQYEFLMDNGKAYRFDFLSGRRVDWGVKEDPSTERINMYDCLKADDRTYLVNMEVEGAQPRTGLSVIIDDEQSLVTLVFTRSGEIKQYPNLITQEIIFGARATPDKPLNSARHSYTKDLVGKRILWHYSSDTKLIHVYYSDHHMRLDFPKDVPPREMTPAVREEFERFPYDEPTVFIKIKDGIYLVSCIEEHPAKRGKIGNNMLFLENLKRVHDVGRSFGLNSKREPENYMFSAFGDFVPSDGEIEAKPYVYMD